MTASTRSACALLLAGLIQACGQQTVEPDFTISVRPNRIDNRGQTATVTISAINELGKPGTGKVRLSSEVGSLVDGEDILLSEGSGETTFSCDLAADPGCMGSMKISGTWTTGGKQVTATATVTILAPDGGGPTTITVDGGTIGEYTVQL
ncbi:MAG: hypothetical protein JNG84_14245, partial [Archangium sp.]|nr:hypothetical protein [Archangium sp.]